MWGGFSVKWDIKLSCLLGRLCAVAVPYVSCVIFQLLPLFVATAVVLLSCYIKFARVAVVFFFPSGFFHLPAVRRDHMAQLLHQDLQAVPTQAVHWSKAARRRRKRRREGGREGRRWARLLPRTKSQNIQGLCCETGNSPPCPHEPRYCPPQPALSAWYKMLLWSPSSLFLTKVSLAGGPQLAGSSVPRPSSGNNSGQPPLAVIWKLYGMAWHGMAWKVYKCS